MRLPDIDAGPEPSYVGLGRGRPEAAFRDSMSADGVSATPDEPAAPTTATDAAARKPRGPEVILVSDAKKCTAAVAAEVPNQCDTKLWVVGRTPEGKYVSPARVTVERRLFLLQSVPDGLVKGEFKLPRWGQFSALKKPDGMTVVKGVDCFEVRTAPTRNHVLGAKSLELVRGRRPLFGARVAAHGVVPVAERLVAVGLVFPGGPARPGRFSHR